MKVDDIKRNIPNFPLTALLLAVTVPAVYTVWLLSSSSESITRTMLLNQNMGKVMHVKDQIKYLDEVLTMSANMMVHSGNDLWLFRYNEHALLMDEVILAAISLSPDRKIKQTEVLLSEINEKLVHIEQKAFELALSGELTKAQKSLNTLEYKQYKQDLAMNLTALTNEVEKQLWLLEVELKQNKQVNYAISIFGLLATIIVIIHLGVTVHRWRHMLIMTAQYMYQQERSEKQRLDQEVQIRTEELYDANKSLANNLHQLKLTQDELVEAKKQSSISRLVTGVAHEVNTPLSIGITSNTFLKDILKTLSKKYKKGGLSKQDIECFLEQSEKSIELVELNLERSAKLITNL